MSRWFCWVLLVVVLFVDQVSGTAYVIAAYNSPGFAKRKADVVCDGKDDQVELYASFRTGQWMSSDYDGTPGQIASTFAFVGQSIEWLPGDYYLSSTLFLSQSMDTELRAVGARIHYLPKTGDAVVVTGCVRCRLHFGTIFSNSSNSALSFKPSMYSKPFMPVELSEFYFTGLIGNGAAATSQVATGLEITGSTCTNSFRGTDIRGFHMGVWVNADERYIGKIDTNWFWVSYIRMTDTCVVEGCDLKVDKVDSQQWYVNVDASNHNSIAIRTCAMFGRWFIIMGTYDWNHNHDGTRSLVLDPGAQWNLFYITPPLWQFAPYENNSGYSNNAIYQLPNSGGPFLEKATTPNPKEWRKNQALWLKNSTHSHRLQDWIHFPPMM